MTYMMYRYGTDALDRSINNLIKIIEKTPVKNLILDHHLVRDINWRKRLQPVCDFGEEKGCLVQTFAEYAGQENNLLEANRKKLYKADE